jgi:DNA-binding NarL/FixJ family response regulator
MSDNARQKDHARTYHLLQVFDFCLITTHMETKNRSRVFIVDDHPVVRDGLKNLIEQEEDLMVCGEAADAATALKTIPQISPDVALVDLSLEHSSGLELVKDIKHQYPELSVIVLSMHDELVYGERAVRSGARGYLMKGESSQRVVSALRSVLRGEVFLSERLMAQIASRLGHAKTTRPPIERLSDRELEVFQMLGQGTSTTAIAEKLSLSVKTVQMYVARAKEKFGVTSARELMREAVRWDEAQVR